jgi:hypothetical protein
MEMRTEAIDWLGVLATEQEIINNNLGRSNCIVNKWDTLQFYLKVISRMPGQVSNTQYVVCYSNRLDNKDIVDNESYDEDVRIDDYVKQLKNYFFRFNYEENQAGYFVAKNIDAINLSESYYQGKSFITIPMNMSKHPVYPNDQVYDNYEQLENTLKNGEYVSKLNKYNTIGLENIPYLIFHDTETLEYRIIGNFTGFEYDVTRGIHYDYNELKSFVFEEDWYDDVVSFENNHSLIYVGDYVHKKIMAKLDETEAIAIKERVEIEQAEISNLNLNDLQDNEWEFIEHFEAVAKKDGLFYTKKDLINFHTAVKSSSLVILSGLSGTGKSQLVQCYAKALGLVDDGFHMIPVRPNWNDDSDLIGFVDSMHMVYRPSDAGFINILMEACQERNKNKLYIICFDEMNLARVEHYFSQFLSILEMPEKSRILRLYSSEYESRLYNSDKYKPIVEIGNNIRFIGTVNIDESTFHFSDKVLDRANVIKLDIIPYTEWIIGEVTTKGSLFKEWTFEEYQKLIRIPKESILSEREREFIWKVHELLNSCSKNLGIGPRILKQIAKYLVNLPVSNNSENISRNEGFDIQFVQRIMTKIRGQKEQLSSVFDMESEKSLIKLFDEFSDVSDFVNSRRTLDIKNQELNDYGYTL